MAKSVFVGVEGLARKVKRLYVGIEGKARKIKKAYIGVGGVARQVYSGETSIQYTGNMTVSDITDTSGKKCKLYTLTSSGSLTIDGDPVKVWCCGPGGNGGDVYAFDLADRRAGAGGGGGYVASGELISGVYEVTIGTYSGTTKVGNVLTAASGGRGEGSNTIAPKGGSGGSGGGGAHSYYTSDYVWDDFTGSPGKGAGVSTYPFGITSLKAHCAGGGGSDGFNDTSGGNGGSNGSDGTAGTSSRYSKGGDYGGGAGRNTSGYGASGSFYGAGGGGACNYDSGSSKPSGGSGYQGVAYILVESA